MTAGNQDGGLRLRDSELAGTKARAARVSLEMNGFSARSATSTLSKRALRLLLLAAGAFLLQCSSGSEGVPGGKEGGVTSITQALPKPQGTNGTTDYCKDPNNKCVLGEGDCDGNSECSGAGIVCVADAGPRYGLPSNTDVCGPAHCGNRVQDAPLEMGVDCGGDCGACLQECTGTPGGETFCGACFCTSGQGDCDVPYDCVAGLQCIKAGAKFGFPTNTDVCLPPHCGNGTQDASLGEAGTDCGGECGKCLEVCAGPPGDKGFCQGCACGPGKGDCDADLECGPGLKCTANRGPSFGFSAATDVCLPPHCLNGVLDSGLGETFLDCGGPCGACVSTDLDAGRAHACDILFGKVRCWGDNSAGQIGDGTTEVRPDATPVGALTLEHRLVAAGGAHTCAVSNAGVISCWGNNAFGQLGNGTQTSSLSPISVGSPPANVTQLVAGEAHTCALSGGNVYCWGNNAAGQIGTSSIGGVQSTPSQVSGITSAVHIAAGYDHTCAALGDGTVRCWGGNGDRKLGDNSADSASATPRIAAGVSGAVQVSAGDTHSCALSSGNVFCWGLNTGGVLGLGSNDGRIPRQVGGVSSVTDLSSGGDSICAALTNGQVRCWGRSDFGEVGAGSTLSPYTTPARVAGASGILQVRAGGDFACARSNAAIVCWGSDVSGQLGKGTVPLQARPELVGAAPKPITSLDAGDLSTCAVANSKVYCWGNNDAGQLGDDTYVQQRFPKQVLALPDASGVALGARHSCSNLVNGSVQCWGQNSKGQLGNGTTTDRRVPIAVTALTGVARVDAGQSHTCALRTDGTIACWGNGADGQLGNGATTNSSVPVDVQITGAAALSVGQSHACAVTAGSVRCWGDNQFSQLGDGTTTDRPTPIVVSGLPAATSVAAAHQHTCAVTTAGAVYCWGTNTDGQLGTGTVISSPTPVQVAGISNAKSVTSWGSFTCALLVDGRARCWGQNFRGQLGNGQVASQPSPVPLTGDWAMLAAGGHHTCGLRSDGALACWGYNDYAQTGTGRAWRFPLAHPAAPGSSIPGTLCGSGVDCATGFACQRAGARFGLDAHLTVCTPTHCTNGVQDPFVGETGVDCGSACGACSAGCNGSSCAEFQPLGDLPGGAVGSRAYAVNFDGSVVVGTSDSQNGSEAFRWQLTSGLQALGDLAGGAFQSTPAGVDDSGAVVAGQSTSSSGPQAFRWSPQTGMVGLTDLPGGRVEGRAYAISGDGLVIVGPSVSSNGAEGFRYADGAIAGIGDLAGGAFNSQAWGVNGDGTVVVGKGTSANGTEAFRWTAAGGIVGLGDLAGGAFNSLATSVSHDGNVVAGNATTATGTEAFRWTAASGMVSIGVAPGMTNSYAYGMSADGGIIVGAGSVGPANDSTIPFPFVWTASDGHRFLRDILTAQGIDLSGWTLQIIQAISGDGRVVVGFGINPAGNTEAFRAVIGRPSTTHCGNGVKDVDETDVDCGGTCAPCSRGSACSAASDCAAGMVCGTSNGGCFGRSRSESVCWPVECADGIDADLGECGAAESPCGPNCACVVDCDFDDPATTCPGEDVCTRGLGTIFGASSRDVCVAPEVSCPSNDPAICGGLLDACGPCVCTPDCSRATCANPGDGCGGECLNVCTLGETCETSLHCQRGATCQADPDGIERCRPEACSSQPLAPPLCGTTEAECGAECPRCSPACDGRECGPDPACGTSCGTCGAGMYCDGGGRCVRPTLDPVAKVPDGEGGLRDLPDLPEVPANAVGAVNGAFTVSDLGAAQYAIPIDVPPGRAGIAPALAIRYTPSRTNGELGVGWSLDGLSKIARCPRNFALDGYSAPIRNDESDAFCLDGKRLTQVAPTQVNGIAEYRTMVDSFARIVAHRESGPGIQLSVLPGVARVTRTSGGPDYFEVWTKDGKIFTYGRSPDSLILARNGTRNSWLLTSVRDRTQNKMVFHYDNAAGQLAPDSTLALLRPKLITYTGHGSTEGNREVRFSYESRPDPQVRYFQGAVGTLIRDRIKRISTYVENRPVKNYRLDYFQDRQLSQIEAITECEGDVDARCKAATRFEYVSESGFEPGFHLGDLESAVEFDANGDGVPDFLETIKTVNGMKAHPERTAIAWGGDVALAALTLSGTVSGGVGTAIGVGYAIAKGIVFGLLAEKPTIRYKQSVYLGTGNRSPRLETAVGVGQVQGLPCKPEQPLYFMDYNRDGKDDILGFCNTKLFVSLSIGNGHFEGNPNPFLTLPRWSASPTGDEYLPWNYAPIIYDINGDSLQDILSCSSDANMTLRLAIPPDQGGGWTSEVNLPVPYYEGQPPHPFCGTSDLATYIPSLDIDGDGTPDLIARMRDGWKVLRFSRSLTTPSEAPKLEWRDLVLPDWNSSGQGNGLQFGDFNGDGLLDLWSGADKDAVIWVNTGSGTFRTEHYNRPRSTEYVYDRTAIIDHNADGAHDIVDVYHSPDRVPGGGWVSWSHLGLRPSSDLSSLTGSFLTDLQAPVGGVGPPRPMRVSLATDVDGDGNVDLFAGDDTETVLYGRGIRNTFLRRVVDGLGNYVEITYDGGSDRSGYRVNCEASTWPETCIKRLRGLVTGHKEGYLDSNQQAILTRWFQHRYENARISVTGHGWLGFDKRIVTESYVPPEGGVMDRNIVTTEFHKPVRTRPDGSPATNTSPPYLYPLAGLAERVTINTWTASSEIQEVSDGAHRQRTYIEYDWEVGQSKLSPPGSTGFPSSLPFPQLNGRNSLTYEKAIPPRPIFEEPTPDIENGFLIEACAETFVTDGFGNVTNETSQCGDETSEITTQFFPSQGPWLIDAPEVVTTTRYRVGSGPYPQFQLWRFSYDAIGFLESVTRAPGSPTRQRITTYERDAYGNVESITDTAVNEQARTTQIVYDADHIFPFTVTNAEGHVTETHFDAAWGAPNTILDPNQIPVQHEYDGLGLLTKTVVPNGTTTYKYTSINERITTEAGTIEPRLRITSQRASSSGSLQNEVVTDVDGRGRSVRTRRRGFEGVEIVEERAYDALHRLRAATAPHVVTNADSPPNIPVTRYDYDGLDRLIRIKNPDGSLSQRHYATFASLALEHSHWLQWFECGRLDMGCPRDIIMEVDEEQLRDVVISDMHGRVLRNIDGENIETAERYSSYFYNASGNLYAVLHNRNLAFDPEEPEFYTTFATDDYGRLLSHADADGARTTNTYNGFDEILTSTDSKNDTRTLAYDRLGRLKSIFDATGTATWDYDVGVNARGRLSQTTSRTLENPAGHKVSYTYEPPTTSINRGTLRQVEHEIDGVSYKIDLEHDAFGRPHRVYYPDRGAGMPVVAEYQYETGSGILTGLDEVGGGTSRPLWRLAGAHEGQLIERETFGDGAETTYGYHPTRRFLQSIGTTVDGASAQSIQYDHYLNGKLKEQRRLGTTRKYTYDALGRLSDTEDSKTGASTVSTVYGYDHFGNLERRGGILAQYEVTKPHRLMTVGSNTYQYDLNGNVEWRAGPDVPGGAQQVQYTSFNLPHTVVTGSKTTYFEYGADESRLVRRDPNDDTVRHFVADVYQRLHNTAGDDLEERFRMYAGGRVIAEIVRQDGSDRSLFFHGDMLGSSDTITSDAGDVTYHDFDPFGVSLDPAAPEVTRAGFTGHQHDTDLGLIDMGGRVYDPLAGRFMSPDPVMQAPFWSQGLNRYSYVFNDPVNNIDPSGFTSTYADSGMAIPGWGYGVVAIAAAKAASGGAVAGGAVAGGAVAGGAGSLGAGLGGLAANALLTFVLSPLGDTAPVTAKVTAGSRAAGSTPATQGRMDAVAQNRVQETLDESVREFLNTEGADDRLAIVPCNSTPEECRARALDMALGGPFTPAAVVTKSVGRAMVLINLLKSWAPKVLEWSAHGGKHIVSARIPWNKVIASTVKGAAKYKPGINVEALERLVWKSGTRSVQGKPWKYMEFADDIGASAGKGSRWVRVENAGNTIHGHPVPYEEFIAHTVP